MNFKEACVETVKEARAKGQIAYLYKLSGKFPWGTSLNYWNDWLFKAYPGGRKVLSAKGTKFMKELESFERAGT